MTDPNANALFFNDEDKFIREDDGDIIFLRTPQRCPLSIAALNARLEALPEPSAEFITMTRMMARIRRVEKQIVIVE
jgi:hypothetical protein